MEVKNTVLPFGDYNTWKGSMPQLLCIGSSWPLTNRHLLGVASHLCSPQGKLIFLWALLSPLNQFGGRVNQEPGAPKELIDPDVL